MTSRLPAGSVLIADAEPYICRVLEAKLTRENLFTVVTAGGGAEALLAAVIQPFDLILWDLRIRDTEQMLPRIRACCPMAGLFLMTTDDRPSFIAEMRLLDVAGVLIKPFGLDSLMEQLLGTLSAPPISTAAVRIDLTRAGQAVYLTTESGRCMSRVIEKRQDTFVVVAAPRADLPICVEPGTRIRVEVHGDDALYTFDSRALKSDTFPIPCWELSLPRIIRRKQRRRHLRMTLKMPVVLSDAADKAVVRLDESAEGLESIAFEGATADLSMGGMAIVCDRAPSAGETVRFTLSPSSAGEEPQMRGVGRVVRVETDTEALPGDPPDQYRVAVQYTSLDPVVRRRLKSLLEEPA